MRNYCLRVAIIGFPILASITPAEASVSILAIESGNDVIVSGSGTFNLEAFGFGGGRIVGYTTGNLHASNASGDSIVIGGPVPTFNAYGGAPYFSGPLSFGSGNSVDATSGSGDTIGLWLFDDPVGDGAIFVTGGYVSGSPLNGTMTFENETLFSLGLDPGIYTWSWSDAEGQNADSLTLTVTPEPCTALLLGLGVLGLAIFRCRR